MTWKPGETFEEFLIRRETRRARMETATLFARILAVTGLVALCVTLVLK